MKLNPDIFKAYDVRGTYPDEVDEDGGARDRRRLRRPTSARSRSASAATCGCRRRRWLRRSSTAPTSQGAEVIDYGMIPTDVLYFAVASDGLDGGVEITASHNPKQYNGMKMVRREAFPLSGEAGISDIRDMIAADRLPPPARRRPAAFASGTSSRRTSSTCCRSSTRR